MRARGHRGRPGQVLGAVVAFGLALILHTGAVAQEPPPGSPSAPPTVTPWLRATDASGAPLLADGATPTGIAVWPGGVAVLVQGSASAPIWVSPDGITWTGSDPGDGPYWPYAGIQGSDAGLLVWDHAVTSGSMASIVWETTDGTNWHITVEQGPTFGTAEIRDMAEVDERLLAWGVDRGPLGRDRPVDRLWTGDGTRWSEWPLEDVDGRTTRVATVAPLGRRVVLLGRRGGRGDPDATSWISREPRNSWWPGRGPTGPVPVAAQVAAGGRRGVAIVTGADDRRALWTTLDASSWHAADPSGLPFTLGPETALAAHDGVVIATGVESATGRQGIWLSRNGLSWTAEAAGDPAPDVLGIREVAVLDDTLVVALPGSVWSRPWEPSTQESPIALAPFQPIEKAPLGPRVRRPRDRPPVLAPVGRPSARAERRGIVVELWVPKGPIEAGGWIAGTMRVTNHSSRPVAYSGTTEDPRCRPIGGISADYGALLDAGETWTGRAAHWKRQVIDQSTQVWLGVWPARPHVGCDDVGIISRLAPGQSISLSVAGWMRGPMEDQALPTGTVPVTAFFSFDPSDLGGDQVALRATAHVRTIGRPYPYPTPGQLADAALRTPGFRTWLEQRDPPAWDSDVRVRWPSYDHVVTPTFTGRPIELGLYADSWVGNEWYWLVQLDPWTGRFVGRATG